MHDQKHFNESVFESATTFEQVKKKKPLAETISRSITLYKQLCIYDMWCETEVISFFFMVKFKKLIKSKSQVRKTSYTSPPSFGHS